MILFYSGKTGSGKTYEAMIAILDWLQKGRTVYTNIDGLDDPACREYISVMFDIPMSTLDSILVHRDYEFFKTCWDTGKIPPASLTVIDEAHKIFNCRDWQKDHNRVFADWCSTSRHDMQDLILMTQDPAKVDSQIRSLCHYMYYFRKVDFFGKLVKASYLLYIYDDWEGKGKPLRTVKRVYDKKIFPTYQSYNHADAQELGIVQSVNVLKHPIFFLIPLTMLGSCLSLANSSFLKSTITGKPPQTASEIALSSNQSPDPVDFPYVSSWSIGESLYVTTPQGKTIQAATIDPQARRFLPYEQD